MTLIIIPARMGSKRLPNKPMQYIGGKPLILHCVKTVIEAGLTPVVATDSEQVVDKVAHLCGHVLTGPDYNSGTDRVAYAAEIIDPMGMHHHVINYQGDMPFMNPNELIEFVEAAERSPADITTAVCEVPHVEAWPPAFVRGAVRCHIGLYCYTRTALRRFAAMPQSTEEISQSLEQLRAPHKFSWDLFEFKSMPVEINTDEDLSRAVATCKR